MNFLVIKKRARREAETLTHRNVDLHFGFIEIEKIFEAFFEFFVFVAKFWRFMKINVGNLKDAVHSRNFQLALKILMDSANIL